MKSLFNDNYVYTSDANRLEDMISVQVGDAFRKYMELGYSPREISHVLQGLISVMESEQVLNLRMKNSHE